MTNIINFLERKKAREADADLSVSPELTTQMTFPFEGKSMLYAVRVADFAFPDDFLNFCNSEMPDVLIDLRVAPRLDFVRPVRNQAFELFEFFGIEYRDVLGRLGASSYDMSQGDFERVIEAVDALEATHDQHRPILVLFDDMIFAQSCIARLSGGFQVAVLDSEAIRRAAAEGARERM